MAQTRTSLGLSAISVEGGLINPDKLLEIAATTPDEKAARSYECPIGVNLRDEIARYFRIGQAEWQAYDRLDNKTQSATESFVKALLEGAFGFSGLTGLKRHFQEGHTYPVHLEHKDGRVPVVVSPPDVTDTQKDSFKIARSDLGDGPDGRISKRRPDAALQEWLNAWDPALWGLVFVGDRLRLMRDNASFTRPAYIEADLGAIFRDEIFSDFTALWLIIHATRFGKKDAPVTDCALERWREDGVKSGTAARDRLRGNVEKALLALGNGFLEANADLREKLETGKLTDQAWFEELLRIIYRLIFLAVSEDRDLIHDPNSTQSARQLYKAGYSFDALRERSTRRQSRDPHYDAYEAFKVTMDCLERGETKLGLSALGGLFDRHLTPNLGQAKIANRYFLDAVFQLSFVMEDKRRIKINWRDMATEELGSVYEGLLELVPMREDGGRRFTFAGADEAKGNARKTSGSYYTPDSLVQTLLDSALDPVLDNAAALGERAILDLNIIDPACGSGHFLLGAARRVATKLAKLRDNENPDFQHALRDVVRSCIHGVDRNPMAVELAKVALWIEAVEPGMPLGFLDANIRCGDSLLGVFDLDVLRHGIPDAAYKKLTGDDKDTATFYRNKNKTEIKDKDRIQQGSDFNQQSDFTRAFARLRTMPEGSVRQIEAKAKALRDLTANGSDVWQLQQACDLYIAAFLLPKTVNREFLGARGLPSAGRETVPTSRPLWDFLRGITPFGPMIGASVDAARGARAFHWPLEFPDVMAKGGFDVMLGNPPWERIKLQEKEFFAARSPEIATAANKAARDRLIKALERAEPGTAERRLFDAFEAEKRLSEATSTFVRVNADEGGRFPFTGTGDVNTYALFAELFARGTNARGRAGVIVPTGIATDATTAPFFAHLVESKRLASLVDFENRERIFSGVYFRVKFCLLTLGADEPLAEFAFFLTNTAQLAEAERRFTLSPQQIAAINPNTKTAPVFRSRKDAELTAKIYQNAPVLIDESAGEDGNPWGVSFARLFDMSNDSHLFRTAVQLEAEGFIRDGTDWVKRGGAAGVLPLTGGRAAGELDLSSGGGKEAARYVPLYEGKMAFFFDHRYGDFSAAEEKDDADYREIPGPSLSQLNDSDFEVTPRYWVPKSELDSRFGAKGWNCSWLFAHRGLTNATNERTFVTFVLPKAAVGNSIPAWIFDELLDRRKISALTTNTASLACDFAARQKIGGTNLNFFYLEQFPILPPEFYTQSRLAFITPRALELTYTSLSLAPFARDLGYDGPPFGWDEDRRAQLCADLDAFYAAAYGLTRDELRYILDPADVMGEDYPSETFRVLKNKEIKEHGEYRTQRLVLDAWDRFTVDGTFRDLGLLS